MTSCRKSTQVLGFPGLESLCQNDVATSSHLHVYVMPQPSCRAPPVLTSVAFYLRVTGTQDDCILQRKLGPDHGKDPEAGAWGPRGRKQPQPPASMRSH